MSPIYFIGCDMGGWHTDEGDAIAVIGREDSELTMPVWDCGPLYYPADTCEDTFQGYCSRQPQVVIAIDASLSWPVRFMQLVVESAQASHLPEFPLEEAMKNPYLYRETERFINQTALAGKRQIPLSAPGDKFGNNSSKGQALCAWIKSVANGVYRPPFDDWQPALAKEARTTIIEVYPDASLVSERFRRISFSRSMSDLIGLDSMQELADERAHLRKKREACDLYDAIICAMTAMCYANTVGMIEGDYPEVYTPNDAEGYVQETIRQEGWIFAPKA